MTESFSFLLAPVCFLAALRIGRFCFPRPIVSDRHISDLFRIGSGMILLSLGLFCGLAFGIAGPRMLWLTAGICLLLGIPEAWRLGRSAGNVFKNHTFAIVFLTVYFAFQAALASLPPYARDELIYHLFVPKMWLSSGGRYFFADNIYAYFPQLAEHCFLLGLGTSGETAARFFHAAWGFLLALTLYRFSRKWLGRVPAWMTVFVFLAVPSVMEVMSCAYVDLTFSFYVLLALILFGAYQEKRDWKILGACALMTGGAAAVKYTGIQLALILACLHLVLNLQRSEKKMVLPELLCLGGIPALVLAPYLVRNLILTGWPLFPFPLPGFSLHSVNWDAERARLFVEWLQTFGTRIGSEAVWDVVFAPVRVFFAARFNDHALFEGMIGPVFLMIPFLYPRRKSFGEVRIPALFSLFFLFYWTLTTRQVRFLFPALPVLSFLLVFGVWRTGKRAVLVAAMLISLGFAVFGVLEIARVKPHLYWAGKEDRNGFLSRQVDVFPIYREAAGAVKGGGRLYLLDAKNYGYLLDGPWTADYVFEHYSLERFLKTATKPEEVAGFFASGGATHLLMNPGVVFSETMGLEPEAIGLFAAFLKTRAVPLAGDGRRFLFELKGA